MDYCFDGIENGYKTSICAWLILATVSIFVEIFDYRKKKKNKEKKEEKDKKGIKSWIKKNQMFICSIILIMFALNNLNNYLSFLHNPEICVAEGILVDSYRDSNHKGLFTTCYVLDVDDAELNKGFYMDVFSKKKIHPEEFVKGEEYRFYYEKGTDIIVKIEKLNEN